MQPKRRDLRLTWYGRWNAYVYMPVRLTHFAQHCLDLVSCEMPTALGSVKPDKPDSNHWTQNESNCQPKRCALQRACYGRWNAYVYMPLRITHFAQQWFVWNAHHIEIRKPEKPDTHWTQKNESNCQPERSDLQRALSLHFEVFFGILT